MNGRPAAVSRLPYSAQTGVHERLARVLEKHRAAPFGKPYADYNRAASEASLERRERVAPSAPLILDAGCGVGESSLALARRFPEYYVIGVDRSVARLTRRIAGKDAPPPNLDWVRADLVDYWRLLREANIRLARHYLLYPNPWPKIGQLTRRWHAHPVFPALLALGGVLECRSNWPIYIDEFCFAVDYLTHQPVAREIFIPDPAITPFERKYRASEHELHRAVAFLPGEREGQVGM